MEIKEYQKHSLLAIYNLFTELDFDDNAPFVKYGIKSRMESDLDMDKTIQWIEDRYVEIQDIATNYNQLTLLNLDQLTDLFEEMTMIAGFADKQAIQADIANIPEVITGPMFQAMFESRIRGGMNNGML